MQKNIWHSRLSSPLGADDWGSGCLPPVLRGTSRRLPRVLLLATVLPLLLIAGAFVAESHALLVAAQFIETVLLVNAVSHSLTALLLGSYVPD